ncbi:MAG TPA: hypothetical protein VL728_16420 [Cyclobacteriaceae bacterium]|jgi:hypothetical protein|nr:hypothetical protein [Cyclobacteriaceae bacterium]
MNPEISFPSCTNDFFEIKIGVPLQPFLKLIAEQSQPVTDKLNDEAIQA